MKSKLLVPLVLTLSLGTLLVNVAEAKTHKHVTATFKTHDGKEIRCVVPDEDKQVLKGLTKGQTLELWSSVGVTAGEPKKDPRQGLNGEFIGMKGAEAFGR